jgi:hypothetical protein
MTMQRGYPPLVQEAAQELHADPQQIQQAYRRLADGHIIVLQGGRGEILMANPFSAVPTPFLVQTPAYTCFANCIWDALGVPAMLKQDAHIRTSCADCGASLHLQVCDGRLEGDPGVAHFAVPAKGWWDDVVFT